MKDRILQLLKDIEQKHNVKVLLAVNSGSRGFDMHQKRVTGMCDSSMYISQNGTLAYLRHQT